ncbi:cytidylyltransferase domain-containing protein [Marinagarivorans algicola]|uniref:acylneuraminate cytidylyltransferase family protein n=1 Tax=Marinagarivorans algicola TaxID=1513270 RepID=UPI0006B5C6F4|nr:acylneuraminate cytidylyltransferase family protein [Marinagarivorans algicola]
MRVVALIPARAGSKRLPQKNVLPLMGKPLITWTIEAAAQSGVFDEIVVSTDCEYVAELAQKAGAKIPFLRPSELSGDMASSADVILHAIHELQLGYSDVLVLLQPTSPLRRAEDIINAVQLLRDDDTANCIVSLTECEHSPLWCGQLPPSGSMEGFFDKSVSNKRSQDLPVYFRLNGAIYVSYVESIISNKGFAYDKGSRGYVMPRERSVDIDSQFDFDVAEVLAKYL